MPQLKKAPPVSEILKQQKFDESGPGTILKDFETVLRFVGPEGIKTAGKNLIQRVGGLCSVLCGQLRGFFGIDVIDIFQIDLFQDR